MTQEFRSGVLSLANQGMEILERYFNDGTAEANMGQVEKAMCMIREGVKVSNRDQVDAQVKRSQAVRLMHYIPEERRAEYIALSNPEAKPFLLDRPATKKKK